MWRRKGIWEWDGCWGADDGEYDEDDLQEEEEDDVDGDDDENEDEEG